MNTSEGLFQGGVFFTFRGLFLSSGPQGTWGQGGNEMRPGFLTHTPPPQASSLLSGRWAQYSQPCEIPHCCCQFLPTHSSSVSWSFHGLRRVESGRALAQAASVLSRQPRSCAGNRVVERPWVWVQGGNEMNCRRWGVYNKGR